MKVFLSYDKKFIFLLFRAILSLRIATEGNICTFSLKLECFKLKFILGGMRSSNLIKTDDFDISKNKGCKNRNKGENEGKNAFGKFLGRVTVKMNALHFFW